MLFTIQGNPLLFGKTDGDVIAELAQAYEGKFVLANDLDIYE
nr:hypothetical protein [Marinobacterium profundum]